VPCGIYISTQSKLVHEIKSQLLSSDITVSKFTSLCNTTDESLDDVQQILKHIIGKYTNMRGTYFVKHIRGSQRPSVSDLVASKATRAGVVTKVACSKVKGKKSGGEEELLSTNTFDKDGYCFVVELKEEKSIVYSKRDTNQQNDDVMPNLLINGIETRAKCLIRVLMSLSELSIDSLSESKLESENKNPVNLLLSNLFQIALLIHYSSMSGLSDCHEQQLLTIGSTSLDIKFIHDNQGDMTMAATVVLATLCETCPPTTLLLGSGKSDSSILDILGLIIKSASTYIERAAATNDDKSKEGNDSSSDEIFSTTSIVLSLLIAMLELGADKRSESDESFFKSILPPLLVLCAGDGIPEVAEMASHAMALIAARGSGMLAEVSEPPSDTTTDKMSSLDRILKKLSQAEKELQSTQPPLRAKGAVSLRHIARSLVNDDEVGGEDDASLLNLVNEKGNAKITEVQTTSGEPFDDNIFKGGTWAYISFIG